MIRRAVAEHRLAARAVVGNRLSRDDGRSCVCRRCGGKVSRSMARSRAAAPNCLEKPLRESRVPLIRDRRTRSRCFHAGVKDPNSCRRETSGSQGDDQSRKPGPGWHGGTLSIGGNE